MYETPKLSSALSAAIEIYRNERKINKSQLAEASSLDRRYLRDILQGRSKPTVNAIYAICNALEVSPADFFQMVETVRDALCKAQATPKK